MERRLYVLTGINITVLIGIIAFSGLGRAVAAGATQVFVTNTASRSIPVQVLDRPWQQEVTVTGTSGKSTAFAALTAPSPGCLTLEAVSGVEEEIAGSDWSHLELGLTAGKAAARYEFPTAGAYIETTQTTLHADPGSQIDIVVQYPATLTGTATALVDLSGSIHPCT